MGAASLTCTDTKVRVRFHFDSHSANRQTDWLPLVSPPHAPPGDTIVLRQRGEPHPIQLPGPEGAAGRLYRAPGRTATVCRLHTRRCQVSHRSLANEESRQNTTGLAADWLPLFLVKEITSISQLQLKNYRLHWSLGR